MFFKLEFKPGVGGGFLRAFTSQKGPGKGLPASGFAPERRESPEFPRAPRSSQPLPSAPALGFNSTLTRPYLSPSLSSSTGAAKAVGKVIPALNGKLTGTAASCGSGGRLATPCLAASEIVAC